MAKKQTDQIALQRGETEARRLKRWWLIPLGIIAMLVVGVLVWLNWRRISSALEARPTLPPAAALPADGSGDANIYYQTDFQDPATAADWEIFNDGNVRAEMADGQLVVGVNALVDTGTWSGLNLTFEDFVLDVKTSKIDGPDDNGIIVVFRLTDTGNYNRFDISSDGYYSLSKARGGEPIVVSDWQRSSAIVTGNALNVIRVHAVGSTFSFEVNGTRLPLCVSYAAGVQPLWDPNAAEPTCLGGDIVETWEDADLPRGKIGLGAQGFTGFDGQNSTPAVAVIGFDDLVIWSPNAPEVQP